MTAGHRYWTTASVYILDLCLCMSLTKSLSVSVLQGHTEAIRACWMIAGMSEQCWVIYKKYNFFSTLAPIPLSQDELKPLSQR